MRNWHAQVTETGIILVLVHLLLKSLMSHTDSLLSNKRATCKPMWLLFTRCCLLVIRQCNFMNYCRVWCNKTTVRLQLVTVVCLSVTLWGDRQLCMSVHLRQTLISPPLRAGVCHVVTSVCLRGCFWRVHLSSPVSGTSCSETIKKKRMTKTKTNSH